VRTAGQRDSGAAGRDGSAARRSRTAGQHRSHAVFLLSLIVGGCFGPRHHFTDDAGPSPMADGFELTLNNRHWLDINVFVQHDGESSRVTTVTASSSQSLILPLWMLGESRLVRIIAEPVGEDGRYTTDLLRVGQGQSVEVNVESTLARSNYSIQ
jgi:hypothetical protein